MERLNSVTPTLTNSGGEFLCNTDRRESELAFLGIIHRLLGDPVINTRG
jgi:hypothetical protein